MTFDSDFDDDDATEELLETARSRSIQENVKTALELAGSNWHRHGGQEYEELSAILTVLAELAEKQVKPKSPMTVNLPPLHTAVRKILSGVYTEAEVAEDMASFRKLLAPESSASNKKLVLSSDAGFETVHEAFVTVFGQVEEEHLRELLGALAVNALSKG